MTDMPNTDTTDVADQLDCRIAGRLLLPEGAIVVCNDPFPFPQGRNVVAGPAVDCYAQIEDASGHVLASATISARTRPAMVHELALALDATLREHRNQQVLHEVATLAGIAEDAQSVGRARVREFNAQVSKLLDAWSEPVGLRAPSQQSGCLMVVGHSLLGEHLLLRTDCRADALWLAQRRVADGTAVECEIIGGHGRPICKITREGTESFE